MRNSPPSAVLLWMLPIGHNVPAKEVRDHLLIVGVANTIMAAAGSAFAADLAVRSTPPAYPSAPPAYSAYDWGGMYIGGVIDAAWSEIDSSDPNFGILGARVGVPAVQPSFSSGFIGGVEGGLRYQLGKLVVGTEAVITWGSVNWTSTTNWVPLGVLSRSISADTNWIGTATSTVGIANVLGAGLVIVLGDFFIGSGRRMDAF
jgi:hypothetical protein